MKKLSLVLVGAGGIGKIWLDGLKKTDGIFNLVKIVDTDKEKAEVLAKDFGAQAETDWEKAVNDKDVDAVLVCTPHAFLAPVSLAALKAGKHVLCEKPAGISSLEVKRNVAAAKKTKKVYMVGFNHRYHPAFSKAKEIFEEGKIGDLLFLRVRYGFGGRPGYEKEWRFDKKISGGGELIDQGMHMIDMARWFLGNFKDIQGFAENLFWGGKVEDNGFLLLRTNKHQVAQIHVSWTNWEWVHSFEIYGTAGYLVIDGLDQRYRGPEKLTVGTHNPREKGFPKEEIIRFENEKKEDSFMRELTAFRVAIDGKEERIPRGEDAIEALKIVERIYRQKHK